MQEIWSEDPVDRPDFRAIVIGLAGIMRYRGDIESELKMETANCRREHPYQKVKIPAAQQYTEAEGAHLYSVLEEPIYNNYSREQSLDPPEEYEVPVQMSLPDSEVGPSGGGSLSQPRYEMPERGANRSPTPPRYEVPELGASVSIDTQSSQLNHYEVAEMGASVSIDAQSSSPIHYEVPDVGASIDSQSSPPIHYEVPEHGTFRTPSPPAHYEVPESGASNSYSIDTQSSVPVDYEVPQSTPERKIPPRRATHKNVQVKPEAPPRRSSAHQNHVKDVSSPIRIPKPRQNHAKKTSRKHKPVGDNEPYEMMTFGKALTSSTEAADPSRYLKLNYPAVQKSASATNSQEDHDVLPPSSSSGKGYSTLEWTKDDPNNYNSLPSKFSLKTHVYHTLEPPMSQ